ncbi:MAG: hypothetical protein JWN93_1627 [Hyphomicrobiales bacterium]|jgi:hypothetical protein|nr:hypothetical protein [Hyphomicrobiales bacterium]
MTRSTKAPETDRHHGGPGSSHQREDLPDPTQRPEGAGDDQTPKRRSRISGGGGEPDRHHTHDPRLK